MPPHGGQPYHLRRNNRLLYGFKSCPRTGGNQVYYTKFYRFIQFQVMPPHGGQRPSEVNRSISYASFKSCPRTGGNIIGFLLLSAFNMFQVMPPHGGQRMSGFRTHFSKNCFKSCPRTGGNSKYAQENACCIVHTTYFLLFFKHRYIHTNNDPELNIAVVINFWESNKLFSCANLSGFYA